MDFCQHSGKCLLGDLPEICFLLSDHSQKLIMAKFILAPVNSGWQSLAVQPCPNYDLCGAAGLSNSGMLQIVSAQPQSACLACNLLCYLYQSSAGLLHCLERLHLTAISSRKLASQATTRLTNTPPGWTTSPPGWTTSSQSILCTPGVFVTHRFLTIRYISRFCIIGP